MGCYSIISRPTNEVEIDFKLTPDEFKTFVVTNEKNPYGIDSFAAEYVLQMPSVSDNFAKEKLEKCKKRQQMSCSLPCVSIC
jgi:hypothetical protein